MASNGRGSVGSCRIKLEIAIQRPWVTARKEEELEAVVGR